MALFYYITEHSRKYELTYRDRAQISGGPAEGGGTTMEHKEVLGGGRYMHDLDFGVGVVSVRIYVKAHQILLKYVPFIIS